MGAVDSDRAHAVRVGDKLLPRLDRALLGRFDHALVGRSPAQDKRIADVVDGIRRARSADYVVLPLMTLARNLKMAPPHFPEMLALFINISSGPYPAAKRTLYGLHVQEIDFLLQAWGADPKISGEAAARARRILGSGGRRLSVGNLDKQPRYMQLAESELHVRDGEQLARVLKRAMTKAELTPTQMVKKTGIVRSQIYYLIGSKSLPRKPAQVKAFLDACWLHPEQVQFVLKQWRQLDQRRGERASEPETQVDDLDGRSAPLTSATVPATESVPATEETETIRVDGPNGRSIVITGSGMDVDHGHLAKALLELASKNTAGASERKIQVGAVVGAIVMTVLTMLEPFGSIIKAAAGVGDVEGARASFSAVAESWVGTLPLLIPLWIAVMTVMVRRFVRRRKDRGRIASAGSSDTSALPRDASPVEGELRSVA